ncbi:hypothetical protein D3C71_2177920 [compost metagenome]
MAKANAPTNATTSQMIPDLTFFMFNNSLVCRKKERSVLRENGYKLKVGVLQAKRSRSDEKCEAG